jgi:putative membrane protein
MDPQLEAILTTWELRQEILIPQILLAVIYLSGWIRLRQKHAKIANNWRLFSYISGHVFFSIALYSGIDFYQTFLFFIHMIQHLLLVMIVPPLIFLAAPMPISFWGLPRIARIEIGKIFGRKSTFRKILTELSSPALIWLVFTISLWLWHDPGAYDAAIQDQFVHDLEHISFFVAGLLLWWHITGAAPRIHKSRSYGMRLVIVGLTYFQNIILGMGLSLWGELVYTHYARVPRFWNLDPVDDQTIGGLIMWLPGGMMYLIAIIFLVAKMIEDSEKRSRIRKPIDTRKVLSS